MLLQTAHWRRHPSPPSYLPAPSSPPAPPQRHRPPGVLPRGAALRRGQGGQPGGARKRQRPAGGAQNDPPARLFLSIMRAERHMGRRPGAPARARCKRVTRLAQRLVPFAQRRPLAADLLLALSLRPAPSFNPQVAVMRSYCSPSILPLYTSFVAGQELWMVMPYCEVGDSAGAGGSRGAVWGLEEAGRSAWSRTAWAEQHSSAAAQAWGPGCHACSQQHAPPCCRHPAFFPRHRAAAWRT